MLPWQVTLLHNAELHHGKTKVNFTGRTTPDLPYLIVQEERYPVRELFSKPTPKSNNFLTEKDRMQYIKQNEYKSLLT